MNDLTPKDPIPAADEPAKRKSNLDLINECDQFPYYQTDPELYLRHVNTYYHLKIPDRTTTFGFLLPSVAELLRGVEGWELNDDDRTLTLVAGTNEPERTAAVAKTAEAMRVTGHFEILKGWRDELYPVYDWNGEKIFDIERAASGLFGVVTYGAHMTGYVRSKSSDGKEELKIWVPKRAASKSEYPGMLDNTVAGGLATGEEPFECLVREADEEASLPEELVRRRAKAVGSVTYFCIRDDRAGGETNLLQPECQYTYDLEMDETDIPQPHDDEVESFQLMNMEQVKEALAEGKFKPNCSLVLLDFFIRHGILTQQNERHYLEILSRLHRRFEFPVVLSDV